MKRLIKAISFSLLIISLFNISLAFAAHDNTKLKRIRGTVWYVSSMDLYGIMSENEKKYHPIKKLPNAWMKDGLEVVVEGKIRDDLVGDKMWGTPFEVVNITAADKYVSWEDKEAIKLFILRMKAFNTKNLADLKKIDVIAAKLTPEQFQSWIFDTGNYTLHYVATDFATESDSKITGICLYSRQHLGDMSFSSISGNKTVYAVMNFTINKIDNTWKFTDISTYVPEENVTMEQLTDVLLKNAVIKYGTDNLAGYSGQKRG